MHETAAERERRLRQLSNYGNFGGGEFYWYDMDRIMTVYGQISEEMTNPCAEIVMTSSRLCTLGTNPLVKFNKFNFKF